MGDRSRAAGGPGQRRWIRLTFAGRDRMTGNRRELPPSRVAGHPERAPHRAVEGSPCGRAHPLLGPDRSGAPERLLGRDRPDETGELAGAGDDDLLRRLAASSHPLTAPGALKDGGLLAALAAGELVADRRPAAGVPGGLNEQAAHVGITDLGDRALAAALARGVLRGDEPDEGHELLGRSEAAEVTDLDHDPERGQGVDAAQA